MSSFSFQPDHYKVYILFIFTLIFSRRPTVEECLVQLLLYINNLIGEGSVWLEILLENPQHLFLLLFSQFSQLLVF